MNFNLTLELELKCKLRSYGFGFFFYDVMLFYTYFFHLLWRHNTAQLIPIFYLEQTAIYFINKLTHCTTWLECLPRISWSWCSYAMLWSSSSCSRWNLIQNIITFVSSYLQNTCLISRNLYTWVLGEHWLCPTNLLIRFSLHRALHWGRFFPFQLCYIAPLPAWNLPGVQHGCSAAHGRPCLAGSEH